MNDARFQRRTLLKAMGVGAAMLPLLHAETALADPNSFPKRLITVTWTNGIFTKNWAPSSSDLSSAPMPPILQPLESLKSKVLIPRGVDLQVMVDDNNLFGGHFAYPSLFTGTAKGTAPSIDQLIANDLLQKGVSSPQLNLGCRPYGSSTSWHSSGQANTAETDPFRLFKTLFGGKTLPPSQIDLLRKRRKSVLDAVGSQLSSFLKRVGTDDKVKIQAHLDSIRALEKALEAAATQATCTPPSVGSTGVDFNQIANYPTHTDLMMKLAAAAVTCDIARTVTIDLIDDGGGNSLTFPWLNIHSPDYHAIAHNGDTDEASKTTIDTWFYSQVATLAQALNASVEGAGTALDNSVVVVANDMQSNGHNVNDIPFLLIGSCGGFFKTGRVVDLKKVPHNQLLTTLCHATGLQVADIGATYKGDIDSALKA